MPSSSSSMWLEQTGQLVPLGQESSSSSSSETMQPGSFGKSNRSSPSLSMPSLQPGMGSLYSSWSVRALQPGSSRSFMPSPSLSTASAQAERSGSGASKSPLSRQPGSSSSNSPSAS